MDQRAVKSERSFLAPARRIPFRCIIRAVVSSSNNWQLSLLWFVVFAFWSLVQTKKELKVGGPTVQLNLCLMSKILKYPEELSNDRFHSREDPEHLTCLMIVFIRWLC